MTDFSPTLGVSGVIAPLIDVVLGLRELGTLRVRALVDSGADISVIPAETLMPYVTFEELPSSRPLRGAGGSFETRVAPGAMGFLGVAFANGITVAAPGSGLPYPVLGREDFFRRFEVLFRWHRPVPAFSIEPAA